MCAVLTVTPRCNEATGQRLVFSRPCLVKAFRDLPALRLPHILSKYGTELIINVSHRPLEHQACGWLHLTGAELAIKFETLSYLCRRSSDSHLRELSIEIY